jgi:competence ComEA-like helix-hairpin-helix protein
MLNFTPEEKKVILFLLVVAFCGIGLNNLAKLNCRVKKLFSPEVRLAKIDLNKISLAQLIETRCLSEKTSQRIIEYRLKYGDFTSLDGLKEVKGVGEKRFDKLKELFFVE